MDWKERMLTYGKGLDRAVYEDALGVGIDFEDGCDAFWILPGEVTSTVPAPAEGPAAVEELIEVYERISRVRERALHVLRHHFADRKARVDRCRSGQWGLERDTASSTLSVGAYLTAVARDSGDVYEVVKAAIENTWLRRVPSRQRIERYLETPGPPPDQQATGEQPEPEPPGPQTIESALAWLGLCRVLESFDERLTPEDLVARARPTGRIGQTMMQVAKRLPQVKAYPELMKPGTLSMEFDDDYAGSFEIDTKSRELAQRIARDGSTAVGDALADEYLRMNAGRSAVFHAIEQAAAARNWRKEKIGLALLGIENVVHLGETRREVSFKPDAVNDLLQTATPEAALQSLLASNPEFADACVAALNHPRPEASQTGLPIGALAPASVPTAPPLCELDASLLAELDDFAHAALAHFLRKDDRALWEYHNPDAYDAAIDTWASIKDWLDVAERHLGNEWSHPMAILILLDAGDPRGDELARRYLASAEPHHEVSDAEVEIVWRYRHSHPQIAQQWFCPEPYDDIPFHKQRAKLGDPIARRRMMLSAGGGSSDSLDLSAAEARSLSPERQEQLHRELLHWARSDHHWSPPNDGRLRVALELGWRDVADCLEENPYALAGLLTIDRRSDQFDEPGMLLAKDFLLVWSRLAPSPFLGRLIATAHATDLVPLAREAGRRSAEGRPDLAANLNMCLKAYQSWLKDAQVGMAIAWTRCRPHIR